jgi:hypothetical protein
MTLGPLRCALVVSLYVGTGAEARNRKVEIARSDGKRVTETAEEPVLDEPPVAPTAEAKLPGRETTAPTVTGTPERAVAAGSGRGRLDEGPRGLVRNDRFGRGYLRYELDRLVDLGLATGTREAHGRRRRARGRTVGRRDPDPRRKERENDENERRASRTRCSAFDRESARPTVGRSPGRTAAAFGLDRE